MRTRQEIKKAGKQYFKANYWNCVLALIGVTVILSIISGIGNIGSTIDIENGVVRQGPLSGVMGIVSLLVSGPLNIGLAQFYLKNLYGDRSITALDPILSCAEDTVRKIAGYLWMMLWIFLWSLLLIIPGLIKALSYGMTTYILADCPNVQPKDALKLSMRMMEGKKLDFFLFFLSYLGWGLLTAVSCGIVGIFYAGPYMYSSSACWYLECRDDALRRGVITMGQLQGIEPVA